MQKTREREEKRRVAWPHRTPLELQIITRTAEYISLK
jgi:hypothetical protein